MLDSLCRPMRKVIDGFVELKTAYLPVVAGLFVSAIIARTLSGNSVVWLVFRQLNTSKVASCSGTLSIRQTSLGDTGLDAFVNQGPT